MRNASLVKELIQNFPNFGHLLDNYNIRARILESGNLQQNTPTPRIQESGLRHSEANYDDNGDCSRIHISKPQLR